MRNVKRSLVVPQSAEQMFRLVDDIEKYPEYLPWCSNAVEHQRDPDEVQATVEITAAGFTKSFTTHNRLQVNKMIEIRLVDGPFRHLEGFWLFEDLPEGGSNIAVDLEFEFSASLLSFAFEPIFHQAASSLIDAFCQRANELYGEN